jgi:hypothetical protein
MIPLSPVLLIAAAGALMDGARAEGDLARSAERFRAGVGPDGAGSDRWDVAFVHHAGYWAHFDHRTGKSTWPLPGVTDCEELAAFARTSHVLSIEPAPGEVFLLWSPSKRRFVHAGIVLAAERFGVGGLERARYECHTMEGNITATGCMGGDRLARVRRILAPGRGDRTVRWADLTPRAVATRRRAA